MKSKVNYNVEFLEKEESNNDVVSENSSFFKKLKIFFYILYLFLVKNNWYRSKRGNFCNSIIGATVYRYGEGWNIARYNIHYDGFQSREEAKNAAFWMWLREKNRDHLLLDRE